MGFSVAVDGPAGAGKSTIAKEIAKRMNLIYIDTGAMYRAMALFLIRSGVGAYNSMGISLESQRAEISLTYENGEMVVWLNGEDVTGLIRTEEVGNMASKSSVNADVRKKLVSLQQNMAAEADVIMDGRDIGTCVLPNADIKVYLTADSFVRATRRFEELTAKGIACDIGKIEEDIIERDYRDMHRELNPLKQAEDAVVVDSSYMSIEEVVETISDMIAKKKNGEA